MNEQKLLAIIADFRANENQYLFVDEFLVSEDFHQFVQNHKLLFLEDDSDKLYKVHWTDTIFLLWNEELMHLELYKNLEDIKVAIQKREGFYNELPTFDFLQAYIEGSPIDLHKSINSYTVLIKSKLSEHLSIDPKELNYTKASLELLDHQLTLAKIDETFVEENLIYLSLYIGATCINELGGDWVLKPVMGIDQAIPLIETKENRFVDVIRVVHGALTYKYGDLILPSGIYSSITNNPFTPHA